jgi:hypothetical protein
MRTLFIAAALLIVATTAAQAEPVWTAPGWYQVADTIVGPFVWKGPFADQSSCEAVLPPNEEDADYSCEYLNERPSWDD